MGNRVMLFLATNIALMALVSVVMSVLGAVFGIETDGVIGLIILSAVIGMGGSFASLAMSKWIAKRATGAHVIEQPRNDAEKWLVETTHRLADEAGIGRPEVAIYDSPDLNAFATGAKRDNALVAVSTGLVQSMRPNEVEAVLAHEVSHIANGDMVTLTLIQGVLNAAVFFIARVLGQIIDRNVFGNRDGGRGFGYYGIVIALQIALGFLASMVVMSFSRRREYRADAGGASLTSNEDMAQALERLRGGVAPNARTQLPEQVSAMGIRGSSPTGIRALLMSHPPIDDRIAALRAG